MSVFVKKKKRKRKHFIQLNNGRKSILAGNSLRTFGCVLCKVNFNVRTRMYN